MVEPVFPENELTIFLMKMQEKVENLEECIQVQAYEINELYKALSRLEKTKQG